VLVPGLEALGAQQIAQQACAGEGVLERSLVYPAHQRQVLRRDLAWHVVRARTGQPKQGALMRYGELVVAVNHRLAGSPPAFIRPQIRDVRGSDLWLGTVGVKWRASRFSATDRPCVESVVTLSRRWWQASMPFSRLIRSTRALLAEKPGARSSRTLRGRPQAPLNSASMARISAGIWAARQPLAIRLATLFMISSSRLSRMFSEAVNFSLLCHSRRDWMLAPAWAGICGMYVLTSCSAWIYLFSAPFPRLPCHLRYCGRSCP